ncbi:MAG: polyprenyl synthetase family protein [Acidobacteriota bacterium]
MKAATQSLVDHDPLAEASALADAPAARRGGLTPAPVLSEPARDAESSAGLPAGVDLLARLESICAGRGLDHLAERLEDLAAFVGLDMATFETEMGLLPARPEIVGRSATHLLDLGGKRLRPMLLTLAARAGGAVFDRTILDLAVAIELVHSATLLHDDVVDVSDARRGAPTARAVYGNAASIFAGDWLLVEALRRVERAGRPELLRRLFGLIEEMIFAESLQLENRGTLSMGRATYFRVVEGKTASVFRWATRAGAMVGELPPAACDALAVYGEHLGVSFQAVDDLLDLTGDEQSTGKSLFGDLVEGKMTLPLILALEREPALRGVVEAILAAPADSPPPAELFERVVGVLRATEAVTDTLALARERSALAVAALHDVPDGRARRALETIAESIVDRDL